jgi:hypothetical protein
VVFICVLDCEFNEVLFLLFYCLDNCLINDEECFAVEEVECFIILDYDKFLIGTVDLFELFFDFLDSS